jgi:hypothetical protein
VPDVDVSSLKGIDALSSQLTSARITYKEVSGYAVFERNPLWFWSDRITLTGLMSEEEYNSDKMLAIIKELSVKSKFASDPTLRTLEITADQIKPDESASFVVRGGKYNTSIGNVLPLVTHIVKPPDIHGYQYNPEIKSIALTIAKRWSEGFTYIFQRDAILHDDSGRMLTGTEVLALHGLSK